MNLYFAPMEGITGYVYRRAHHSLFPSVDRYFTPFLTASQKKGFSSRELNDILPEHNRGIRVVPQILTNRAEDFIWAAEELKEYGYREINLNLGCPSGTVVAKGKGSGFLAEREELDRFLDRIFSGLDMEISIKTRIGKESPQEFYRLIEIFNRYPVNTLIIHPRIQTDYYKNRPNLEVFEDALSLSRAPVCYNGDLFSCEDWRNFANRFPDVDQIMLGRGLVANPGLCGEIRGEKRIDKQILRQFHDLVLEGYLEIMSGDKNALFKMKELWFYMGFLFTQPEKYLKKIKKSERLKDYASAVDSLFQEQELAEGAAFSGKTSR